MTTQIEKDSLGNWRKWCSDELFDVIIWFKEKEGINIHHFQVCIKNIKLPEKEVVMSWDKQKGFEVGGRGKIDKGEDSPHANLSPLILPSDIRLDYLDILKQLTSRKKYLGLSDHEEFFIQSRIAEFAKLSLYE